MAGRSCCRAILSSVMHHPHSRWQWPRPNPSPPPCRRRRVAGGPGRRPQRGLLRFSLREQLLHREHQRVPGAGASQRCGAGSDPLAYNCERQHLQWVDPRGVGAQSRSMRGWRHAVHIGIAQGQLRYHDTRHWTRRCSRPILTRPDPSSSSPKASATPVRCGRTGNALASPSSTAI